MNREQKSVAIAEIATHGSVTGLDGGSEFGAARWSQTNSPSQPAASVASASSTRSSGSAYSRMLGRPTAYLVTSARDSSAPLCTGGANV